MPKQRKPYDKEIQAFAAFDERWNVLYGTVKSSREKCQEALLRFNPKIEGHHYPYKVMPIYIGLDLNTQHEIPFDE